MQIAADVLTIVVSMAIGLVVGALLARVYALCWRLWLWLRWSAGWYRERLRGWLWHPWSRWRL